MASDGRIIGMIERAVKPLNKTINAQKKQIKDIEQELKEINNLIKMLH